MAPLHDQPKRTSVQRAPYGIGAKIEALNVDTGLVKQTTSDSRGSYLFSDLQPGTYSVTISAPSFGAVN